MYFQKHEQVKSYVNRKPEQNYSLTLGLSAVYQLDCERFSFLAADQFNGAFLSL